MKAQDIVILLKIIVLSGQDWMMNDLSKSLYLSQSEVSKALERMSKSGLIDESKKNPARSSLYDLIVNSIKYVFPAQVGRISRGVPTAYSAKPLSNKIRSESQIVWPSIEGKIKGESLEPLYKNVVKAALEDQKLYEMLSLIDALRIGKAREVKIAKEELKKRFGLE